MPSWWVESFVIISRDTIEEDRGRASGCWTAGQDTEGERERERERGRESESESEGESDSERQRKRERKRERGDRNPVGPKC